MVSLIVVFYDIEKRRLVGVFKFSNRAALLLVPFSLHSGSHSGGQKAVAYSKMGNRISGPKKVMRWGSRISCARQKR